MGSSYDHGRTRVHAGGGHQTARRGDPELTPAQRDRDAVRSFQQAVAGVEHAVQQLAEAKVANDPEAWVASRARLTEAGSHARRAGVTARRVTDEAARAELSTHERADAARHLLKFQGPLGYIRRLLSKLISKLTGAPGYGTAGFEARLEVKKLREIQAELEALKARLVEHTDAAARGERRDVDREIANIQEQLEHHARRVDSFEPGSGVVAARGLPEYPIKKSTTAWQGTLAFENKLNFWREYFRLQEAGLAALEASIAAAEAISFGKHRIALGFTKFNVTFNTEQMQVIDFGGSVGIRKVPQVNVIVEKP